MSELKISRMVLGMCQTNCYFVYKEGSTRVLLFDPADNGKQIYDTLKTKGFEIAAILLTHGHFDHILGCNELKEVAGVKTYACESEKVLFEDTDKNVSAQIGRPYTVKIDHYMKDLDVITLEGMKIQMIHTPGHTIGSCCYYFLEDNLLISGDTLFEGSVGRTDLPTGSMSALNRSIREKLAVLPGEVKIYPGHGDSSTMEHEMKYNPYCQ